ncbi:putative 21.7 KDA protein IN SYRB 5'REGION (ORF4) (plasmid) [Sinorhizobium sojae CCBAU 05684]|uniref:Putative 21.7 kDa protein IN SYRB 5'REGION (ORF4) n=1 Tax=Sinorhizobium sojae CCBAU 05684 TaxID=716928 RepID=A0A249PKQ4_9HYPH|nr:putative 21.7 KDA protein IN SYRB 5'REGION (ORF4) [Sinorhizobium sojae CCBAU 05684]
MAAQSGVAPKHHQSLQPSSSRDLFFHEVATLDEEIKMLRSQLAQKLHLQNVQLKKMLERFDVS